MISVVVPYIDNTEITSRCIELLARNTLGDAELVLIDNGSDKPWELKKEIAYHLVGTNIKPVYVRNKENVGVLQTFKLGLERSSGDVICFFHNDVLVHESGWNIRVQQAFDQDPKLGLAGLFGARGVHPDGGREGCMSHMLGAEWGKVEGAQPAALHHGELMTAISPCVVFDGVGLFFRRTTLQDLADNTDLFADWRAPHHFYDRIMSLKTLERGYHMAVIGIQFDHYSGATANHSEKYVQFIKKWCDAHGVPYNGTGWDNTIYWHAEKQWRDEFAHKTPVHVDIGTHNVRWGQ